MQKSWVSAILPIPFAPVATADAYDATEDLALAIDNLAGVLANDSDADGDPITAALASNPTHGAITFNSDGSFTYSPFEDYHGPDSFTYTITDGPSTSDPATVTINVAPVDDAPGAGWDTYWLDEDTTLATTAVNGLLANDFDVDGDTFTMTQLTSPTICPLPWSNRYWRTRLTKGLRRMHPGT